MFKVNRVGTPIIHTDQQIDRGTAYTISSLSWNSNQTPFNAVNGAQTLGDFGETKAMVRAAGSNFPASTKCAIVQQFTVPKPVEGDVVGVELNGSIMWLAYRRFLIKPFIAFVTTPATTNMGAGITDDFPTHFGEGLDPETAPTAAGEWLSASYQTQVILRRPTAGGPEGVYVHGFQVWNTGADATPDGFNAEFSLRQVTNSGQLRYTDQLR